MNDEIRRLAEKKAAEIRNPEETPEAVDTAVLIHDLKVHQIELEMQNEELRNAQTVLEEARREYAGLYNNAPVGYLSLDADGIIRRVNYTFPRLIGLPEADLTNRHISEYLTDKGRDSFLGRYGAFYRRPEGKTLDATFRVPKGETVILQLSARRSSPAGTEGRDLLLDLAAVDVTAQRIAAREARDLAAEKELLLRELKHRTKNNFQTVTSLLGLQASLCVSPEAVRALEQAEERVRTMMMLQESLSAGGSETVVHLAPYLDEIARRTAELTDPAGTIHLNLNLDDCTIDAPTANNLGLVFNELLTNAYKHAFRGRENGKIDIALKSDDQSLRLTIIDDGLGSAGSPPAGGSGLGLILIEALTVQMGGSVEIEHMLRGTRCTLEITEPRRI